MQLQQITAARGPVLAFGTAALGASVVAILGGPAAPSDAAWTVRLALVAVCVALLCVTGFAKGRGG